ncbi:MAG: hypothetical protein ACLQNG_01895 [Acidimicrobiales bacterium]|jgi:hypothetical protein
MTSRHRTFHLPDYAIPAGSDWGEPRTSAAPTVSRTTRAVAVRAAPRGVNRASARVVYTLMLSTSAMALVDLYLLATSVPH